MELSLKDFLGKYLDRKLQVKDLQVDAEGRTSFTFVNCPFSITIDPRNGVPVVKAPKSATSTSSTKVTKRSGSKEKECSDEELEQFMMDKKAKMNMGVDPSKKTRRIKCPKTGDMITSEQYHINKKSGMYDTKGQ